MEYILCAFALPVPQFSLFHCAIQQLNSQMQEEFIVYNSFEWFVLAVFSFFFWFYLIWREPSKLNMYEMFIVYHSMFIRCSIPFADYQENSIHS